MLVNDSSHNIHTTNNNNNNNNNNDDNNVHQANQMVLE